MYTGNCGHAYECEKWKKKCDKCPDIKRYPKSLFFDFTQKMFLDKQKAFENFQNLIIVTPSNWLAKRVGQSFLKKNRIEVINNGINTEIFKPRNFEKLKEKHRLKNDKKIILGVAPDIMSKEKGGEWILQLADKFKNEDYIFILIGVADLNKKFPKNIIPLGRTENQIELAEYYSMADLFVICSLKENYPTTCLEAQACGTEVVGFDVGGTKETVHYSNSNFVEYGNIIELKRKIETIIDQPSQNIKNEFSSYIMIKKYLKIYERKK